MLILQFPEQLLACICSGHRSTIVALGTGSGQFLLKLLHDTQPYAIHML